MVSAIAVIDRLGGGFLTFACEAPACSAIAAPPMLWLAMLMIQAITDLRTAKLRTSASLNEPAETFRT